MSERYSTYYSAGEGYHPYRFIDNVVYTDDLITFYFETYDPFLDIEGLIFPLSVIKEVDDDIA